MSYMIENQKQMELRCDWYEIEKAQIQKAIKLFFPNIWEDQLLSILKNIKGAKDLKKIEISSGAVKAKDGGASAAQKIVDFKRQEKELLK